MALFFRRHPVAVLYCGVIGVLRTLSEGHAIYQLFTHPDMTAAEAFSSAICSHLMTPAINAALAVLQVLPLEPLDSTVFTHAMESWRPALSVHVTKPHATLVMARLQWTLASVASWGPLTW